MNGGGGWNRNDSEGWKYARQLCLKRHKLVVNYCAVAAVKVE